MTTAAKAAMIARPPTTPPTIAPTGVGVEVEVEVVGELGAVLEAAVEAVFVVVAGTIVDMVCVGLKVNVAIILVRVGEGAAVDEGGL
jgi:hypothetical protein